MDARPVTDTRSAPPATQAGAGSARRLRLLLLPELARFPGHEQAQALRLARRTPLGALELSGVAAGLVAVAALTRLATPEPALASRLDLALLDFAVALPLLAAVLAPVHLRRLRRGLRAQLAHRGCA